MRCEHCGGRVLLSREIDGLVPKCMACGREPGAVPAVLVQPVDGRKGDRLGQVAAHRAAQQKLGVR